MKITEDEDSDTDLPVRVRTQTGEDLMKEITKVKQEVNSKEELMAG